MCAMPHSALAGMTSDPRTGVVAVYRSVYIVMEKEDFDDEKEALLRKLNRNVNKFYPDVGGILMGYQGIKMKRSTSVLTPTPVNFRAEFFLFRPQVGSDLLCVVMKREEGKITCLAHGVFKVEVYSPPQCWERVFVGQMVVVKVEAVEQMAFEVPRIVATLVEMTRDNFTPFIDIVENLDDEFERLTDSNMFEYEQNSASHAGMGRGDRSRDVLLEKETRKASSASQSPLANVETIHGDGASKKRKAEEVSSSQVVEEDSPAKKRLKKKSIFSPVASETASKANKRTRSVQFPVSSSHQHPAVIPPPSSVKSMPPPPPPASAPKSKSSPVKKTPSKMITTILPKSPTVQSKSADNDHNSSRDDEDADVAALDDISNTIQDLPNDSVVAKVPAFQPLDPPVTPGKLPKLTVAPKTPKTKARLGRRCPPGFQSVGKKKMVKLTAPDGCVFDSYKKAWKWVDNNPTYLVKSELELANPSLASTSATDRSSPDMFTSQPASVKIPQVVDGGGASEKTPVVSQSNKKQPKLPKKSVPTPLVKARRKVEANRQKLLVDPPSYSEPPEAEPQSQNLLVQESDAEYKSQSLLLPSSKYAKKTGMSFTKAGVTKRSEKVEAATSPVTSVAKSPGKQGSDNSSAGSSFESSKQRKASPQSKIVPKKSQNTNVDASRTLPNSSFQDNSSDEEPPPPPQSVRENIPVKQSIAPTSDNDDTTPNESDSSNYTVAKDDIIENRSREDFEFIEEIEIDDLVFRKVSNRNPNFLNDATEIDNVTLDNILDNIKGLEDENFLLRESLKLEKERFEIENEEKVSIQHKLEEQNKQMEDIMRSKKSDGNPAESDRSASDKNAKKKKVVGFL